RDFATSANSHLPIPASSAARPGGSFPSRYNAKATSNRKTRRLSASSAPSGATASRGTSSLKVLTNPKCQSWTIHSSLLPRPLMVPDTLGLRGPVAQNLETAGFWVRSESDSECLAGCIGENQPALGFTVTEGSRFVTPHKRGNARWEPQELAKASCGSRAQDE